MVHVHCMLDTQGYIYTLGICNTYSFAPATMVARTRLNVNTLRTGDADLRFYITTVQDG